MDNFDLRKFLAESRQPIQEMEAPMEGDYSEGETMEEVAGTGSPSALLRTTTSSPPICAGMATVSGSRAVPIIKLAMFTILPR